MTLNLQELLQKAKDKKIVTNISTQFPQIVRPWQQESVMFTSDKPGNNPDNQQDNHQITNEITETVRDNKQGNNKITTREQTREQRDNNQATNETAKQITNEITRAATGTESSAQNLKFLLSNLSGLQLNTFNFILDKCLCHEDSTTGPIATHEMAKALSCSYQSLKMTLHRLVKKELIDRLKGKGCKGGFIVFSVPKPIQVIALENKRRGSKTLYPDNQQDNKRDNNQDNHSGPISSSIYITTTKKEEDEWSTINIEPLRDIGFSETQLMQLKNRNAPDLVQESILHFAFGLEHNPKTKAYSDPLNVLMGVLRKGQVWFEQNYKSPEMIAREKLIEQRKRQLEQQEKLKEEELQLNFEEWYSVVENIEKQEIEKNFNMSQFKNLKSKDTILKAKFFEYYKNIIVKTND